MLVGRGAERGEIDGLLERARAGHGAGLLVRGEPGIGKTALLDYAAQRAEGFLLLQAVGVETESELAFAALHELLRPLLSSLHELPPAQADALGQALALTDGAGIDRFAAYAATLSLLAQAATERPVLCLVDDAQWIDTLSAEAIAFAGRRLRHDPVVVLLAARSPDPRHFAAPGLPSLELSGLHREASEALLDRAAQLPATQRERVLQAAGGNPLALLELPAAIEGNPADDLDAVGATPLPIGRRLEDAFLGRVRALSGPTQRALLVVAASDTAEIRILEPAIAKLGLADDDPRSRLEEMERADLVSIGDGMVVFAHPLVRSAVYQAAEPADRRTAHGALANVLRETGDAERWPWHLAAATTTPDEEVAAALEDVGRRAQVRGGLASQRRALERAARLTPDTQGRARRLVAAARAARGAGLAHEAESLLGEALRLEPDEATWAEAQAVLADIYYWFDRTDDILRLRMDVDRIARAAPGAASEVLITIASQLGPTDLPQALALVDEALALEPKSLFAQMTKANYLFRLGRPETDAYSIAAATTARSRGDWFALSEAAVVLGTLERYDEAHALAAEAIHELQARGALKTLSHALCAMTQIETRRGDLMRAQETGLRSLDLAEAIGEPLQIAFAASFLAAAEALRGLGADVRTHAAAAMAALPGETVRTTLEARAAIGLLELQLGHPDQAVADLERVVRACRSLGIVDPGYVQAAPELIEALIRSGQDSWAEDELSRLEHDARTTNRVWAMAAAARCRGLMASDSDVDRTFADALAWHAKAGRPVEQARTELAYGERLRRAGRRVDAREQLRKALGTFERTGARLFADRAAKELGASGEHLRRTHQAREELSPQELQVCLAVARGASNKEAASELFLSPKTIEFHLRNAYQKLGIRSRTQLAPALGGSTSAGQ